MMKATCLGEGRHLRLVRRGHWEYVERKHISGIVLILALTADGKLVLTEQYRPPVDCRVIELPAGLAGDAPGQANEDLAQAARRELYEECGYEADQLELLTEGPPSAGLSSEYISLFKATGLRQTGTGGGDASEAITVHEVPLAEVHNWLEARRGEGLMIDPKVYAGLYFAGIERPAKG